ncbi:hypothetical protein [Polluticaenibacter yanchengensis]|uniref:Lipoprotein n=1 Tax=Polluticaenibacter yanchengensis TaxID=3014562 RepID=A0ABT4UKE8_9BACT|nr:hypothetical protein [Chitinophagaceae bacterium LY-5]
MKYFLIAFVILLVSCGQTNTGSEKNEIKATDTSSPGPAITKTEEKTVKFLWRDKKYDEVLKDTFNSIFINEAFCKVITDEEKAALGYVATFIGNECSWDGPYKDDRSNLKCKILTALNLGYQCSEQHLGFLRKMFKDDKAVLEALKPDNCPTTPDGATIQNTFDEITLTVSGNQILVSYKAQELNSRDGSSRSWTGIDHFEFGHQYVKLIKKESRM